jgi:hypothetical protein
MAESKLTPSQLYSRCIIWEKIRAEYFERIGDNQRAMQCHANADLYERKYQELPEVAHLYNPPQGAWK